jgi:hypothetical protein
MHAVYPPQKFPSQKHDREMKDNEDLLKHIPLFPNVTPGNENEKE